MSLSTNRVLSCLGALALIIAFAAGCSKLPKSTPEMPVLRVQIVDEQNRPMFALASAQLQPYAQDILREIAPVLNGMPNRISLAGHTDATPFAGGGKSYSNWELSADRANAARRVLIGGGLDEGRLIRVIGLSSAVLLEPDDPLNPNNRRISIILLNKRAEDAAMNEGRLKTITLNGS